MRYTTFGKTGWKVSSVSYGSWALGGQWGSVERHTAEDTVYAALDAGINLIDTSDAYGTIPGISEGVLGRTLAGRRHQVHLVTKVGNFGRRADHPLTYETPLHVYLCCDASLHRLRTDYIDVYLCHIGGPTPVHANFIEAFERLVEQGKIRAYGISTDVPEVLDLYAGQPHCVACEFRYNLIDRNPETNGLLKTCIDHNLGTLIRSPLRSGMLTGKFTPDTTFTDVVRSHWNEADRAVFVRDVARADKLKVLAREGRTVGQVALSTLLTRPGVTTLIPGAKDPQQLRANAAAADMTLTPEELALAWSI